jgi:hypothetical protein
MRVKTGILVLLLVSGCATDPGTSASADAGGQTTCSRTGPLVDAAEYPECPAALALALQYYGLCGADGGRTGPSGAYANCGGVEAISFSGGFESGSCYYDANTGELVGVSRLGDETCDPAFNAFVGTIPTCSGSSYDIPCAAGGAGGAG